MTLGAGVLTVDESDPGHRFRDSQPNGDVVDRRAGRNIESRRTGCSVARRKVRREGGEESDFDDQRAPDAPAPSAESRTSAIRKRSPGRMTACFSRPFQRRMSRTGTPY